MMVIWIHRFTMPLLAKIMAHISNLEIRLMELPILPKPV